MRSDQHLRTVNNIFGWFLGSFWRAEPGVSQSVLLCVCQLNLKGQIIDLARNRDFFFSRPHQNAFFLSLSFRSIA